MIGVYNNYFLDLSNVAIGRWQPKRPRLMVGRDIAPVHKAPEKEKIHGIVLSDGSSLLKAAQDAMSGASELARLGFDPSGNIETAGQGASQLIGRSDSCSVFLSYAGGQGKIIINGADGESREFALTGGSDLRISFNAEGGAEVLKGAAAKVGGALAAGGENEILVRLSGVNVAAGKDTTVINLSRSAGGHFSGGHNVRYLGAYNGATIEGGSGTTEFAGRFSNCDISALNGKAMFSGVFMSLNGGLIQSGLLDDVFSGYFQGVKIEDKGGNNKFSGTFLGGTSITAGDGDDSFDGLFFDSSISAGNGANIFGNKAALQDGIVILSFVRTKIEAGNGRDTLAGAASESSINLGEGDDEVNGLLLSSELHSGFGGDKIRLLHALSSVIDTGAGDDDIHLYTGDNNSVTLGEGDDRMTSGLNRKSSGGETYGTAQAFTGSAFLTARQAGDGLDPRFGHHFGDVRNTSVYADAGEDEVTVHDGQNTHQVKTGTVVQEREAEPAGAEEAARDSLIGPQARADLATVNAMTKILQRFIDQGRVGHNGALLDHLSGALEELKAYQQELLGKSAEQTRYINYELGGRLSRSGGNSVTIHAGDGESASFDSLARNALAGAYKLRGKLARHCLLAYAKCGALNA